MGPILLAAIDGVTVLCRIHGQQSWVPACLCVIGGTPPAIATIDGVYCAEHVRMFERDDPRADEDLQETCFQCLTSRGLLLQSSHAA
jgi:hypothetical protein